MVELLLLLLPVAAASGWLAGRKGGISGITLDTFRRRQKLDYFRGLNYLLNEQQDKAIELFLQMVEVDSDTIEIHLALGSLYRRRGEVDRAIHLHENLVARNKLPAQLRADSQLELGLDYFSAGLLDRAENLFRTLLHSRAHAESAGRHLIAIYERECEWQMAAETAQRLKPTAKLQATVAHYYCEMAHQAQLDKQPDMTSAYLREAESSNHDCARAKIMGGDFSLAAGDYATAYQYYRHAERQDASLVPVFADNMLLALIEQDDHAQLTAFFAAVQERADSSAIVLATARAMRRVKGEAAARVFVKDQLIKRPTLTCLHLWANMELQRGAGKERDNLSLVIDMLAGVIASQAIYLCKTCGFKGQQMHWQCPGCRTWDSIRPQ